MKTILFFVILSLCFSAVQAQKIDSIYFNLYTDSLKKGTHNYINVDGKLSNGKWLPLMARDITFTSTACTFSGNELVVPMDCKEEKITVKAQLKSNPAVWIERTIWIKKKSDPDTLPTQEEVMRDMRNGKKGKRG